MPSELVVSATLSNSLLRRIGFAVFGVLIALSNMGTAHAQRTDYLLRMLATSDTFRVRVQAAISLGRVDSTDEVIGALSSGLRDDHPAVRTACAGSLERLANPEALAALREVRRDRDGGARRAIASAIRALEQVARTQPRDTTPSRGNARFYVGVGEPGNTANIDSASLRSATAYLRAQVGQMDGVELAPSGESNSAAQRVIRSRRLAGFYIDSSIVSVERSDAGTRAVVSVIVNTYPGRDMRAILSGRATVPGPGGPAAVQAAIEGALRGAMRRLGQAMEASR